MTSSSPPKVLASTIDQIWTLVDRDVASKTSATSFSLLLLEQLQALERYLWPGYTNDASNNHLFLLVLSALEGSLRDSLAWQGAVESQMPPLVPRTTETMRITLK